jgi:hypothetical protein
MQHKCENARETYEAVAQSENVPNDVKSNVYKQLGKWDKRHHLEPVADTIYIAGGGRGKPTQNVLKAFRWHRG